MRQLIWFSIAFIFLTGCATHSPRFDQSGSEISVMAYNVENLFDTQHDPGTEDFTYLPLSQKQTPQIKTYCHGLRSKKYQKQ